MCDGQLTVVRWIRYSELAIWLAADRLCDDVVLIPLPLSGSGDLLAPGNHQRDNTQTSLTRFILTQE